MSSKFEDWLPQYPSITDPFFQTLIAEKKEFQDTSAKKIEPIPGPGGLFSYQEFVERYMRAYDKLYLYFLPGTGKTCSYISIAEDYRHRSKPFETDEARVSVLADALVDYYTSFPGTVKKVYVILKGPTLEEEFKRQLLCKCASSAYYTEKIKNARSQRARDTLITRQVSSWFELTSYVKFANKIASQNPTDAQLADEFENCMIVADEIHTVKNDLVSIAKEDEFIEPVENDDEPELVNQNEAYNKVYSTLWKVMHLPRRVKVILSSGTPMINDPNELVDQMNLLLPIDKQLPKKTNLKKWDIAQFREFFMGYISFVQSGDLGVDPIFHGTPLDVSFPSESGSLEPSQMNVVRLEMSSFQRDVYLDVVKEKKKGVRNDERQASQFVFPDGSYGGSFPRRPKEGGKKKSAKTIVRELEEKKKVKKAETFGLGKYIKSEAQNVYIATPEWTRATNSIEKIRKLSCVTADMVQKCMELPGICFIYDELFMGSGAITKAMCLESMGFKRFNELSSPFVTEKKGAKFEYCAGGGGSEGRTLKLNKALRYGLITSETSEARDQILLSVLNSDENRHGEYIKVLIGSRLARDGLNLANVQMVFLPGMWTPSGLYQAMSRSIRATSHVKLVEESKTGRVDVNIYRMAAVAKDVNNVLGENKKKKIKEVSVDLDMYAIAERKDREIATVRRNIKRVAVDCHLHKDRNIISGIDGSAECDYQECTYTCVDPDPEMVDLSTYKLFYSDQDTLWIKDHLPNLFSKHNILSLQEIITSLGKDPTLVEATLSHIISTKSLLHDKYGQSSMLRSEKNWLYLVPYGQSDTTMLDSYYRSVLVTTKHESLREVIATVHAPKLETKVPATTEDVEKMSLDNKIKLIEDSLLKKKPGSVGKKLISQFTNYIFDIKEPTTLLKEFIQKKEAPRGRGRKPKAEKIRYMKETLGPDVEEGESVIVHSLYTIPTAKVGYNIAAKFVNAQGNLRIFKPSEGVGWRDLTIDELPIYNAIIRGRIEKLLEPYNESQLFGSILSDGKFRIHDLTKLSGQLLTDSRKNPHGRECDKSWKNHELVDIAYSLNIPEPIDPVTNKPRSEGVGKSDIIEYLETREMSTDMLKKMTIQKLRYHYSWEIQNAKRDTYCSLIEDTFKNKGLLFEAIHN